MTDHPDRRSAQTAALMAQTGLDAAIIEGFLRRFYDAARADPLLAPAFAGVGDWEGHIARIRQFWCSVALMTGEYHGQPMRAHAHLGLQPAHFARWLALFEGVAAAALPPPAAAHMVERARRIARSLELGLVPFAPA